MLVLLLVTVIYSGLSVVIHHEILREAPPDRFMIPKLILPKAVNRKPLTPGQSLVVGHHPRIPRLVNDVTIDWNETMHRPWLEFSASSSTIQRDQPPPYMVLLTDWGWNHPNHTHALTFLRSMRERELYRAIVNHPYFHPKAWQDIRDGILPISKYTHYYVFADILQCPESNYPKYGREFYLENFDATLGRRVPQKDKYPRCMRHPKTFTFDFLNHLLFRKRHKSNKITATLVALSCTSWRHQCPKYGDQVSVAAIGGSFDDMDLNRDQGFMPPAPNPVILSKKEEAAIANCNDDDDRPLKAVYVGNFRSGKNRAFHKKHTGPRMAYKQFHDPSKGIIVLHTNDLDKMGSIISTNNETILENPSYHSLLRNTKFALVPRGDNKFSYRFTEALSAGAIPIFHGDNHVLPFRPELVDWNRCGLVLPEKDAGETTLAKIEELLKQPKKLCSMRQYCYFEIYQKYVATPTKQINGLLEGLEALAKGPRKEHVGLVCNETSIESLDCNPI